MPVVISTIQRPSHSWKALKTCSQAYACDPYDLYGDQALEEKNRAAKAEKLASSQL